jgi:hypothetical protein
MLSNFHSNLMMITLNFEGIDVVGVQVSVAQSVDELASFEA